VPSVVALTVGPALTFVTSSSAGTDRARRATDAQAAFELVERHRLPHPPEGLPLYTRDEADFKGLEDMVAGSPHKDPTGFFPC
jgi:hypothetical protein